MGWLAQWDSFVPCDVDCCCSQLVSIGLGHPRWPTHTTGTWVEVDLELSTGVPQASFTWSLHMAWVSHNIAAGPKGGMWKLPVLFRLGLRSPRTALGLLSIGQGQSKLKARAKKLYLLMWEAACIYREEKILRAVFG